MEVVREGLAEATNLMRAAPRAIGVNPSAPAMSAITRKINAHFSM